MTADFVIYIDDTILWIIYDKVTEFSLLSRLRNVLCTSIFDTMPIHSSVGAKRELSYLETRYRRVLAGSHVTQRDSRIVSRKCEWLSQQRLLLFTKLQGTIGALKGH